jgi:hypothetical protein
MYSNRYIFVRIMSAGPPADIICSKHVEAINRNKMNVNSASCWSYYTDILRCMVNKVDKVKVKLPLPAPRKDIQGGIRGVAPLILYLGTR